MDEEKLRVIVAVDEDGHVTAYGPYEDDHDAQLAHALIYEDFDYDINATIVELDPYMTRSRY